MTDSTLPASPAAPTGDTGLAARARPRATPAVSEPPPTEKIGILRWLRQNLFNSPFNSVLTIICLALVAYWALAFAEWGILNAVFDTDDHNVCRQASGACWAVIGEKHRPMLFGVYPYEEHWRLVVALIVYLGTVVATLAPPMWKKHILIPMWIVSLAVLGTMLWGGIFGLTYVESAQWGGLPLTMVLFTGTLLFGFPIAILLALGRRSKLPAVKAICVTLIESMRGVPLITILFVAVNVFPLFLPEGMEIDKMLRVVVGMAIFFACYQAEVIRGGLQAIPRGQYEAAEALGLGYWRMTYKIILPQALRICLPGIVNHIIAAFKNTSFVLIIGLFDILTATTAVMQDPLWRRFFVEAYLFVAVVYFIFCFALSKYSQQVERWLSEGRRF
jgi:general L-amino acid transport system permease protein